MDAVQMDVTMPSARYAPDTSPQNENVSVAAMLRLVDVLACAARGMRER
jgi:hypothetical protein